MPTKLQMLQAINRKLSGVIATTDHKAILIRRINATLDSAISTMDAVTVGKGDHWITTEGGSRVLLDKDGNIKGGMGGKFTGKNIKDMGGTKKFTKYATNGKTVAKNKEDAKYLERNYDKERGQGARQYGGVNGKAQAENEAKKLSELTGEAHEIKHEGQHSMNYSGEGASESGKYDLYRAVKSNAEREQAKQPTISTELDSLSVKPKSTFINMVMGSLSEKTDREKQELFNALGLKKGVSANEFKQAAGKHWDLLRDVRMSKKSDRNENLAAIKRQKQEIAINKDIYNQTGIVPDPIDISLPYPDNQQTPEAKPSPENKSNNSLTMRDNPAKLSSTSQNETANGDKKMNNYTVEKDGIRFSANTPSATKFFSTKAKAEKWLDSQKPKKEIVEKEIVENESTFKLPANTDNGHTKITHSGERVGKFDIIFRHEDDDLLGKSTSVRINGKMLSGNQRMDIEQSLRTLKSWKERIAREAAEGKVSRKTLAQVEQEAQDNINLIIK